MPGTAHPLDDWRRVPMLAEWRLDGVSLGIDTEENTSQLVHVAVAGVCRQVVNVFGGAPFALEELFMGLVATLEVRAGGGDRYTFQYVPFGGRLLDASAQWPDGAHPLLRRDPLSGASGVERLVGAWRVGRVVDLAAVRDKTRDEHNLSVALGVEWLDWRALQCKYPDALVGEELFEKGVLPTEGVLFNWPSEDPREAPSNPEFEYLFDRTRDERTNARNARLLEDVLPWCGAFQQPCSPFFPDQRLGKAPYPTPTKAEFETALAAFTAWKRTLGPPIDNDTAVNAAIDRIFNNYVLTHKNPRTTGVLPEDDKRARDLVRRYFSAYNAFANGSQVFRKAVNYLLLWRNTLRPKRPGGRRRVPLHDPRTQAALEREAAAIPDECGRALRRLIEREALRSSGLRAAQWAERQYDAEEAARIGADPPKVPEAPKQILGLLNDGGPAIVGA